MDRVININLISNPLNWVSVVLIVAIAGYALALLFPTAEDKVT